jgi:serine/threonine protein kinase
VSDNDPILDLLVRLEEARERGEEPASEGFGVGDPALLAEVAIRSRRRAQLLTLLDWSIAEGKGGGKLASNGRWPEMPGFTPLEVLGSGGMGIVYRAREEALGREVALKLIRADASLNDSAVARFRTEAAALARLQHPNIVQIHRLGDDDGRLFLALELVAGGSLADCLDGTPWPPRRAAALVEALARAVHAAHERGIVHRDLKPANVLLTPDGAPKLSDFGLAKLLGDGAGATLNGDVLGTPGYMAPEQVGGVEPGASEAVDVYGLGAILYELLTGRPPFRGATPFETLMQTRMSEPVAPRRLVAGVPQDLGVVSLKCLRKAPNERYDSAASLADDLCRFLDGRPVLARRGRPFSDLRLPRGVLLAGLTIIAIAAPLMALILSAPSHPSDTPADQAGHPAVADLQAGDRPSAEEALCDRLEAALIDRAARLSAARDLMGRAGRSPTTSGRLEQRLRRLSASEPEATILERATRAANLASALILVGDERLTRPLLRTSQDPTARTRLITALGHEAGPDRGMLLARATREADPGVRQALLLAVGLAVPRSGADEGSPVREDWANEVLRIYGDDDDPGVHGAAEWVLRRWDQLDRIKFARNLLADRQSRGELSDSRGWYLGPDRHTFVIIRPALPRGNDLPPDAPLTGGRAFALATHEVSALQLEDFLRTHPGHKPARVNKGFPACPVPLHMARAYCNWLSLKDGLGVGELCYEARENGEFLPASNFLERRGYRLPTEDEWELACFAGAATPYPYGHGEEMFAAHGLSSHSASKRPQNVGRLMPNAYGLFDMLGNACEWCERPRERAATACGGSYLFPPLAARDIRTDPDLNPDAARSVGFRVTRTWNPDSSLPTQRAAMPGGPVSRGDVADDAG